MKTYSLASADELPPKELEIIRQRTEEHCKVSLSPLPTHYIDHRQFHCYEWEMGE